MLRAALFAMAGLIMGVVWLQSLSNPAFMDPVTAADWFAVVSFSVGLLALAISVPVFAQLAGGQTAVRVSLVSAIGLGLGGVSNFLEDGMQLDFAFWFFVAGALLSLVGLLGLTIVMAVGLQGRRRLLAAVPAATLVGQLTFPVGGGLLMMSAWLAAAAVALARSSAAPLPVEPASP